MKFKLTPLNVAAMLFIAGCIIYTLVNYTTLSNSEGWGVVFMVGLFGLGLSALLVDLIVRIILKKSKYLHLISAIITMIYIAVFFAGSF